MTGSDPRRRLGDPRRRLGDPRRQLGAKGEGLARRHLEARGFTLLDANFRTRHGELDLVAADRRHLVFCEVKTRILTGSTGEPGPFAAIGPHKRRQLRLMAREWLAQRGLEGPWPPELRFDAIGIAFDREGRLLSLEHLEGAF
jgi:putative endonuclease